MSLVTDPSPVASAPTPRRRSRRRVLAIAATLAAGFVATVTLVVNESTKNARKVSDRFVTAVQRGDGAAAYALAGPAFRRAASEQQIDALATQLSGLVTSKRSLTAKSINASTDSGKIAVFVYDIGAKGGGELHFKTQVRKEDGAWKVFSYVLD